VADSKNAKESSDAKRKTGAAGRRSRSFAKGTIRELRWDLDLIDKTMAALTRLSRLRQRSRST
jgi:hypothetical protein